MSTALPLPPPPPPLKHKFSSCETSLQIEHSHCSLLPQEHSLLLTFLMLVWRQVLTPFQAANLLLQVRRPQNTFPNLCFSSFFFLAFFLKCPVSPSTYSARDNCSPAPSLSIILPEQESRSLGGSQRNASSVHEVCNSGLFP